MPAKRRSPSRPSPSKAAKPAARKSAKPAKKPALQRPAPARPAPQRIDPARIPVAPPRPPAPHRWALVTARDLMRSDPVTVSYSAPLSEVERVLADARISGAPVIDETGRIVGVISVKDLVERYAEDEDARPRRGHGFFHLSSEETLDDDFESFEVPEESEETARDLMTAQVFTVPAGAGLKEVADAMCKHKVHRVLVEEGGRLVGLVSTLDILEALRA